jgi:hypothetical protein
VRKIVAKGNGGRGRYRSQCTSWRGDWGTVPPLVDGGGGVSITDEADVDDGDGRANAENWGNRASADCISEPPPPGNDEDDDDDPGAKNGEENEDGGENEDGVGAAEEDEEEDEEDEEASGARPFRPGFLRLALSSSRYSVARML